MINVQKFLAIASVCLALTVSGFAKPGNGNGNGNGNGGGNGQGNGGNNGSGNSGGSQGSSKDSGTTFVVGEVSSEDSRIMDVSGDYDFSINGTTLSVSIVQDARGKFTSEATLTNADGSTSGPVKLNGHLQLTGQSRLRLQLNGGGTKASSGGFTAHLRGDWNGTTFPLSIKITTAKTKIEGTGELVPVNTERGFTIADGPLTGSKGKLSGNRTVTLPWGTQSLNVKQQNKKKEVTFSGHTSTFGIDLRGNVEDNTTFTANRAKLKLGYGSLTLSPSDVTVSGSAQ